MTRVRPHSQASTGKRLHRDRYLNGLQVIATMARTSSNKRKSQPAPAKGRYLSKSSKKRKKSNDLYEAQDSDPDEERHAQRYDHVDNYEYEMPSDFEDEEIDEDLAFTEEDKKKYAGWFGEEAGSGSGEDDEQQHGKKRARSEFADLESSDEEPEEEEDEEIVWDEGEAEDMKQHMLGSGDEQQRYSDADAADGSSSEGKGSGSDDAEADEESEDWSGDEEDENWDDQKHRAMLAAALGKDEAAAVAAQRRKKAPAAARNAVVAEAYNESEAHAAAAGAGELRLADLLEGLAGSGGGLGGARKLLEKLDKKGQPVAAPLPRTVAERLERKAGYEDTKQEVTKWQPIVKSNREVPTLRFTSARHEVGQAAGSTSALVAGFTPATDDPDGLEAQVAALLGAAGSAGAAAMEEADLALAEKQYTLEEAKARADRLAKMRHLLFYAELKAKRLAKIKSKEHHRRANKAARRAAARLAESAGDEQEAARKAEEDAEFERAKERLTLKHKNSSKWARRALKRGQTAMDPSMREAIAAQLALGQQLRRKMEGGKGSGSDSGSGESDESTSASEPEDQAGATSTGRLMSSRNRKEALAILKGLAEPAAADGGLAGDDAAAAAASKKKGLFALPFMVRALEKQRTAAAQEAAAMLEGMEGDAQQDVVRQRAAAEAVGDDAFGAGSSGRFTFGGAAGAAAAAAARAAAAEAMSGSDEEEDVEAKAERLSRQLAGEAGHTAAATKQTSKQHRQPAARVAGQQQQHHAQLSGPDVGYVEIELPGSQAAAGKRSKASEVAADATAVGEMGNGALPEAHTGLFGGRTKQQQQQGDAAAAGTSQQASFLPSKVWQGPKEGYVFKRDKQGVGYYLDHKQRQQQQGRKKGKGKGQQQQQTGALHRQHQAGDSSSDAEAPAATGQQQQQQGQQKGSKQLETKGASAVAGHSAAAAAAAGVNAMQLLSGDGDLQRQLLQAAFAGDDVEAEFAAEKAAEVAAELPSADVEGALPGWGTWAAQQKEPAWMVAAKATAAAKRESAAASRKDAHLKHVVISEKWDKKSAKYLAPSLPFPFKDKAVYEQSIRQPLGRQYNPDAAFRNLTRPAILKDTGVVIEPLRFSKQVEQYNAKAEGKGRAVVTVAGGMQLQGQAAGTGAGGVGKGGGRKKATGAAGASKAAAAGSQKRIRLHDAAH